MTHVKRDRLHPTSASRARASAAVVGALRLAIGLRMAVRPEVVPRALGVDSVSARRMSWAVRMCAARDAALGAGGLHAAVTSQDVRPWLLAQAFSDGGDAVAIGLALRARQVSPLRAAAFGGLAVAGLVGGVMAAREAGGGRGSLVRRARV
jgi:hypothetical protein